MVRKDGGGPVVQHGVAEGLRLGGVEVRAQQRHGQPAQQPAHPLRQPARARGRQAGRHAGRRAAWACTPAWACWLLCLLMCEPGFWLCHAHHSQFQQSPGYNKNRKASR